jgi:hypothetical protein
MTSISEKFKKILAPGGLEAAMRWLNDRVPYRYTAIFAFEGDILRNVSGRLRTACRRSCH